MADITTIDFPPVVISPSSYASIGGEISTIILSEALNTSHAWPTVNLAIFIPFKIGYTYNITNMFWINGTTVGSNHLDIGIYDWQGNRICNAGPTLTAGASVIQSVAMSATIYPGLYYMAMVYDGTTDTLRGNTAGAVYSRRQGCLQMATTVPLPTSATFAAMTTAFMPYLGVTSGSVI